MSDINSVLIVANSARMLAQLASNLGFSVWVIDCYADCDTQKLAKKCIKVDSLSLDHVEKAYLILKADFEISYIIYGSGLEQFQKTLEFLHQSLTLIGNTPEVFFSVQNKQYFFSKLSHLQIPYPEITFLPPEPDSSWLIKPLYGQGGVGVEMYSRDIDKSTANFWQRYRKGTSMSVLFIADGVNFQLIGFNKQLTDSDSEFIFSGVISQPEISEHIRRAVNCWLKAIVKEFVLKGINSLDFIVSDNRCFVLEVNPRPSASMQLYDRDLLKTHINSFLPATLDLVEDSIAYRAYKIIFAKTDCFITENIDWPEWAVDIPQSGSNIHMGMPICSIIAHGANEQQVEEILQSREQKLSKLLR